MPFSFSGVTFSGGIGFAVTLAPGAPTSVTATSSSATAASVSFTAPANSGTSAITSYTVTSSPGNITGSAATSPVTVSGLTTGTAYTFTVTATNNQGTGPASAASNSVTPAVVGQQEYTTAGTYSFVVPEGVTNISAVVVSSGQSGTVSNAGSGGDLRYINNLSVTPGTTLTVVVGLGVNGVSTDSQTKNPSSISFGGTPLISSSSALSSPIFGGNGGSGGGQATGGGGAGGYNGSGGAGGGPASNGSSGTTGAGGGGERGPT